MRKRYLQNIIAADLKEKMVFVGGPRQVGKTTMSELVGRENYKQYAYFNWDSVPDRKAILANVFPAGAKLLIFDELHKYRGWKNRLKGLYDKEKNKFDFLVTGSARLDVYRRGGDSLFGRYHYFRLHPFSLAEALEKKEALLAGEDLVFLDSKKAASAFRDLLRFGGFPEPFVKKQAAVWRRFQNERAERLIKEDIRDLEKISDLSGLQVLAEILPAKVGSLLSLNSLSGDLQVNYRTAAHWLEVLERFYFHFRIYPFAGSKIKSLRKQPKLYLWDWSAVPEEGPRLENMVASHLLKVSHFLYDAYGHKVELNFLRDRDGREVDFLLTVDKKPWFAVEVKNNDKEPSSYLSYFAERLNIPFLYQVIGKNGIDFYSQGIRTISADKFLTALV